MDSFEHVSDSLIYKCRESTVDSVVRAEAISVMRNLVV